MKSIQALALGLIITSSAIYAMDVDGNYAVWGAGKKSCYGFNKDMAAGSINKYKDYMKGFLTAYNIYTEKTYNISGDMDADQIIEWLHAYCDDNPMVSLEGALIEFTLGHHDSRKKSAKQDLGGGKAW